MDRRRAAQIAEGVAAPLAPERVDDAPTQIKSSGSNDPPETAEISVIQAGDLLDTVLDHFQLLDCIGVGGMGRVFRARDSRLDRLVALKVLAPDLSNNPDLVARFEKEAKAASRLDSPFFARVYYYGEDKGLRFIAMEYVEGVNLRRRILETERLEPDAIVLLGLQLSIGLGHASARGFVHRDIKPSNIILTPEGGAKLVDMGLARDFMQQADGQITQTNMMMGTLDYISPEQAADPRRVDVRSDVYSLGCTLFHAAVGQPPYPTGNEVQKLLQHQNDPVPDVRAYRPDFPDDLASLLVQMMAKRPEDRPQSPAELIREFRMLAAAYGVSAPLALPAEEALPPRKVHHLSWAAPTLILVASVAVFSVLSRTEDPDGLWSPASFRPEQTAKAPEPEKPPMADGVEIVVPADADLQAVVRDAPAGAVLRLVGAEYELRPSAKGGFTGLVLDKPLTLRPVRRRERTVLKLAMSMDAEAATLVSVRDSRVELQNLHLVPPANRRSTSLSVERGRVELSDCVLDSAAMGSTAVRLQASSLVAEDCRFSGGEVAVAFSGGDRSVLRASSSCFSSYKRVLQASEAGRVEASLRHVVLVASGDPPFQFAKPRDVECRAEQCVFACTTGSPSRALIEVGQDQLPEKLWRGRDNLYAGGAVPSILLARGQVETTGAVLKAWGFVEENLSTLTDWPFARPMRDAGAAGEAWQAKFSLRPSVGKPGVDGLEPGLATESETSAATAAAEPAWKVDPSKPTDSDHGQFASLREAIDAAGAGARIIQLSAERGIEERGLEIPIGADVTLHAASSRTQSIRIGSPGPQQATDAPLFEVAAGAKLTLENLVLSVEAADRSVADSLAAVFRCAPGGQVVLRNSRVVVGRGRSLPVVFQPSSDNTALPTSDPPTLSLQSGSDLRTAGVLISATAGQSWKFESADSRVGADGPMLRVAGANNASAGGLAPVMLKRSTFLLGRGFLSLDVPAGVDRPGAVQVQAEDCLFLGIDSDLSQPFAAVASEAPAALDNVLQWHGDWNLLAGYSVLLRLPERDASMMAFRPTPRLFEAAEWLRYFGLDSARYIVQSTKPSELRTIWDAVPSELGRRLAGRDGSFGNRVVGGTWR